MNTDDRVHAARLCLEAKCISLDATFKVSRKANVVDMNNKRHNVGGGGITTIINERSEVISWVNVSPSV